MKLDEIIEQAETQHRLSQNELARRIGLQPTALSHVMRGRRTLPAEAAIELAELTGQPAKRVWEAAKAYAGRAAVVACVAVNLSLTPAPAIASTGAGSAVYDFVLCLLRRLLRAADSPRAGRLCAA